MVTEPCRRVPLPRSPAWIVMLILMLALGFASGCASFGSADSDYVSGYLFTHTRVPLTKNLDRTPVPTSSGHGKIVHIEEPFSGYGLYAEFKSNAIGDIARRHGMQRVYFADLEVFDLLGIWKHEKLILYGE